MLDLTVTPVGLALWGRPASGGAPSPGGADVIRDRHGQALTDRAGNPLHVRT